MILTEDAIKQLQDLGLTPIVKDSSNPDKKDFYIEDQVNWAKLFAHMRQTKEIDQAIKSMPHYNMILNLIIKRNPKIQPVEGMDNKIFFGIIFKEIAEAKDEKYKRLDRCLGFIFHLVAQVLGTLFNQFE